MKRVRKSVFVCCLAVCCAVSSILPAHAGTVTSLKKTETQLGITYTYYATLGATTNSLVASTKVNADQTIPAGYVGCQVWILSEADYPVCMSDMVYNTSPCKGTGVYLEALDIEEDDGYFYAIGGVKFYTQYGYRETTTYETPFNKVTSTLTRSNPTVSESGRAEGLGFMDSIQSGLIPAVGQNGISGYIKASDIQQPEINSPEEAVAYMETLPPQRTIPLYADDGTTVIDTFLVVNDMT